MKVKDLVQRTEVPIGDMARKIRELRQDRGLTLEQVATVVGVGKSTVRKWETGMIANMKRDKIAALAKALGTTPAYLMGWEEADKEKESPAEINLTEGEKMLLDLFRRIPEENRAMVLEMIRAAVNTQL
jgi:transcriptional regulator with XRE-family HTH domain